MQHVMIDLETMGCGLEAAIVAVAAVRFDPATGQIGDTFYRDVTLDTAVRYGGRMDPSTVMWWMGQSDAARSVFKDAQCRAVPLPQAIEEFASWIPHGAKPWGNGATFDLAIFRSAYGRLGMETPWKFWDERDVRTVVEMGQAAGFDPKRDMPFQGTRHNALDDSRHQAAYVSAIWQRLVR